MERRWGWDWFKTHYLVVAVVAFAGFWLFRVGTNSEVFDAGAQILALVVGLALFVAAAVVLFRDYREAPDDVAQVR